MSDEERGLMNLDSEMVDPRQMKAYNNFVSRKIPDEAIQEREGAGGKTFKYVSHTWMTEQIQLAFGNATNFEVLDWEVFEDEPNKNNKRTLSVSAKCRLTFRIVVDPKYRKFPSDPMYIDRVVTEVGVFHKQVTGMPTAMAVASAVSRGYCRCVMRMFGLGIELYKTEEEMSFRETWEELKNYAEGIRPGSFTDEFAKEYADLLKEEDITRENIMNTGFVKAKKLLKELLTEKYGEDIPNAPKKE